MELIIKWKNFKNAIEEAIVEANDLLYIEREFLSEIGTKSLEKMINEWIIKNEKTLKTSFSEVNNEFVIGFQSAKPYSSYLKSSENNTAKLNSMLDELNTKKKTLEYYLELLSISDAIIQPKLIDTEIRASYTRREIIDLVLDKLYHLYNQKYYPIQRILSGNAIKVTKDSIYEIVELLEQKEYIQVINNRTLLVQLSKEGQEYIENKRNFELFTKEVSIEPEIEKVEFIEQDAKATITPEPVYHYFEQQYIQS